MATIIRVQQLAPCEGPPPDAEPRVPRGEVWERVSAGEALAIACGDVAVVSVSASVLAA